MKYTIFGRPEETYDEWLARQSHEPEPVQMCELCGWNEAEVIIDGVHICRDCVDNAEELQECINYAKKKKKK